MTELIVCRGLPASGKTTRAKAWVAEDPAHRARVNRDMIRQMCHDGVWLGQDTERQIQAVRDAAIRALLDKGISVVCDDTNLPQRVARDIARIGALAKATVTVWDLTDVPLATCLERDPLRENPVGREVIEGMQKRYLNGKRYPLPLPTDETAEADEVAPYVADPMLRRAVMIDIDGTVALHGTRDPYDETRVHEDRPHSPVIAAVEALIAAGYYPIFCSGRTQGCEQETTKWLYDHIPALDGDYSLFMRPIGDMRKDSIVKRELFDQHIRNNYNVIFVLDDRDQVVRAWRDLGLTVFQVADGNF